MGRFINSHFPQIARIILGIIFCTSGINYVYRIFPLDYSQPAQDFLTTLTAQGWAWPVLKAIELLCGLMLIFGYLGPLALFVLAPITLGIVLFHVIFSPSEWAFLGYAVFVLEFFLLFYWRKHFIHIFSDFTKDIKKDRVVWTKEPVDLDN